MISLKDKRSGKEDVYQYEGGLMEFVMFLDESRAPIHEPPVYIEGEKDNTPIEIAIQYNSSYTENILTYFNNVKNNEGGFHLS